MSGNQVSDRDAEYTYEQFVAEFSEKEPIVGPHLDPFERVAMTRAAYLGYYRGFEIGKTEGYRAGLRNAAIVAHPPVSVRRPFSFSLDRYVACSRGLDERDLGDTAMTIGLLEGLACVLAAGFVGGVISCHRVSMWWRWGDRGRR